jgi:hypothetical protein
MTIQYDNLGESYNDGVYQVETISQGHGDRQEILRAQEEDVKDTSTYILRSRVVSGMVVV